MGRNLALAGDGEHHGLVRANRVAAVSRDLIDTFERVLADPNSTRDDVADLYREALSRGVLGFPWAEINTAVEARWSRPALLYIKRKAWR